MYPVISPCKKKQPSTSDEGVFAIATESHPPPPPPPNTYFSYQLSMAMTRVIYPLHVNAAYNSSIGHEPDSMAVRPTIRSTHTNRSTIDLF